MKEKTKSTNGKQKRLAVSRESSIPLIPLEGYKVVRREAFSKIRNPMCYHQRKQQEV